MFNVLAGNVVTEVIDVITSWISGFMGAVLDVIEGLIPIFYDATAETNKLTIMGVLGLMGISIGLVRFGMRFVQRFFVK